MIRRWLGYLVDVWCVFLCVMQDRTTPGGRAERVIVWVAEHTTPNDW